MIKKAWIIPHEAFEIFGWTILDCFSVLKLYLHRLPAKAAEVSGSHFWKKSVYHRIMLGEKKFFISRHLQGVIDTQKMVLW